MPFGKIPMEYYSMYREKMKAKNKFSSFQTLASFIRANQLIVFEFL